MLRGCLRLLAVVLVACGLAAAPPPSLAAAGKGKGAAAVVPKTPAKGKPDADAATATGSSIETEAKHAIIVEMETGTVLLDKAADERLPPASMTKMMTAYVVFGMLKQGRIKLDDELPVSDKAWKLGGSKMFVPVGGKIKIDDLLKGVLIQSGNDACIVLAEGLAGSEEAFVQLMNAQAKAMGLEDSHFTNVTGLPDPDHWMTARDLATVAIRTIKDFPEYYHYYSEMDFEFDNIKQGNRNPLLYKNFGADGLKTGHTDEAGFCLTASVVRGNRRVIAVLAGLPTMRSRGQESERLIEWAFREFNDYRLFGAGDKVDDAAVWLGADPKVPMTIGRDLVVTLPRKSRKDMKVTVSYDGPVPAPVAKGQPLGKLVVTAPDVAPTEAPLVAGAAVDRLGPIGRMATVAGYLVWGHRN